MARKAKKFDKVRMATIGVGGMGTGHCTRMQEIDEVELVAVCDMDPEIAEAKGKEFGVPYYTDYKKCIKASGAEAVTIATPHFAHPPVAIYAMRQGLHVLSEKPIAATISQADKMVRTARKTRRLFTVMFQRRFSPSVIAAMEIVKKKQLGRIYRTCLIATGFRSMAYYNSAHWRATWMGEGGGVLVNQAPHPIDVFCELGGMPSKVLARCRSRIHDIEVEDEAQAMLTYSNGATGYMIVSTSEAPATSLIEICGEQGKLTLKGNDLSFVTVPDGVKRYCDKATQMWGSPKGDPQEVKLVDQPSHHGAVIRNLALAIRKVEPLHIDGAVGCMSIELANAIIMSSELSEEVKLPISRPGYDVLMKHLQAKSKPKRSVKVQRVTDPGHVVKKGKK